jgi:hypothetical protein
MVYSRVLRALAAAGAHHYVKLKSGDEQYPALLDELANQLNEEFAMSGVRIKGADLVAHRSALEIAGLITRKMQ